MNTTAVQTVDDYIASYPEDVRNILNEIRATIKKVAPQAEEAIKYGLPTFLLNGNLVHFGAFKNHIGFYPTPNGIDSFRKELSKYKGAKGSVQFPLDQPMPLNLIARMVEYRMKVNEEKMKAKKKK